MKIKYIGSIVVPLLSAFIFAGCGSECKSSWKTKEIIIDGKDNEWKDPGVNKEKLFFGAQNDRNNLYICFSTEDKGLQAQLLGMLDQTVTLWFYCPGQEDNKLGVLFKRENPPGIRIRKLSEAFILFQKSLNDYKVINMRVAPTASSKEEFEIKAGYMNDRLVLELKMPLVIQETINPGKGSLDRLVFEVETSEIKPKTSANKKDSSAVMLGKTGIAMKGKLGLGGNENLGAKHLPVPEVPLRLKVAVNIELASEPKDK